jgi:ABC transport system ATP-binding/permease protein
MTYLSVDKLSKNYGLKVLFENLTFGIQKGEKMALIAPNGTGKSTLLRILAGQETPDRGQVMTRNGIRIAFLEQEPTLQPELTISGYISSSTSSEAARIAIAYEKAVHDQAENFNEVTAAAYEKASAAMDAAGAWDFEQRLTQILGKLNIHDLDQPISTLSGGEKKRVALAFALIDEPDLLILDEPTNHLDVEMIEWLEGYLTRSTMTLLMVTHDRYFLDRVCNQILELSEGVLYHHRGNYSYYLEKRAEREEVFATEVAKAGQLLKKELDWMRRQPKARTTKSKSRIASFYETEKKASSRKPDAEMRLEVTMSRMGNKILELERVSKSWGEKVMLRDFSYTFSKGERIGVIGPNGVGKSTFLKLLTGEEAPDAGKIDTGTTIVFGHYRQQHKPLPEDVRVIDVIKEVAEVITLSDGSRITASQFLEHFMFPGAVQYAPVAKLSGGERRRLALMMVLVQNPNFLILDEPTNDLDLVTLGKLEEFLLGFGGCLIVVSHDRFFMDRLVQHYFAFEGDGKIRDFNGTYLEYRELMEELEEEVRGKGAASGNRSADSGAGGSGGRTGTSGAGGAGSSASSGSAASGNGKSGGGLGNSPASGSAGTKSGSPSGAAGKGAAASPSAGPKLSFNERKEFNKLEQEIARLEVRKSEIEAQLSGGTLPYEELQRLSAAYAQLSDETDEKTLRWLELAERA